MEGKSLISRRAGASTPELELQKALEKNRNHRRCVSKAMSMSRVGSDVIMRAAERLGTKDT
jgi:hypothetical protein